MKTELDKKRREEIMKRFKGHVSTRDKIFEKAATLCKEIHKNLFIERPLRMKENSEATN